MSDDPPIPAHESLTPSILLVEEYSALGVAISSALKKFAPQHATRVAQTFTEAESLAAELRPELFILDLDPPPASGEIEFFYNLKRNFPHARVLVIAAGTSRELRAQRGTAGAIQFVEKPFDLAEFGAAVQALLGPWTAASAADHLRGTLQDLDLIDLVQLKCLAGSSAVLRVEGGPRETGEIHLQKGQIRHAVTAAADGQAAFEEIAGWPDTHVTESESLFTIPQTIEKPWPIVLLQVARKLGPAKHKPAVAPSPPAPAKTGKKILVIDDTEMLRIFVEDILATSNPDLQILTAATGAEGIKMAGDVRPDLVLLDYSLTDTTGDQVCRALRDNSATARIPILMMSGHISELIRTEADYKNVVDALPKPFLSGALVSAVEKALAHGPLATTLPPSTPVPAREPAAPATAAPLSPTPSSNGHTAKNTAIAPTSAPAPAPAPAPTPGPAPAPAPAPAPTPGPAPAPWPAIAPSVSEVSERSEVANLILPPAREVMTSPPSDPRPDHPMELTVTLSLKVVDMRFSSTLTLAEARLELFDRTVSVKMDREKEMGGVPLESGFRIHRLFLNGGEQIEMLRLVPTRQPPHMPVPNSSFPVGSTALQRIDTETELTLTAPTDTAMRVRLTAACELASVELSDSFEVEALLLHARGRRVYLRNAGATVGRPFEIVEVQLNGSSELRGILVRALNEER